MWTDPAANRHPRVNSNLVQVGVIIAVDPWFIVSLPLKMAQLIPPPAKSMMPSPLGD